jgi:hypothetical protein
MVHITTVLRSLDSSLSVEESNDHTRAEGFLNSKSFFLIYYKLPHSLTASHILRTSVYYWPHITCFCMLLTIYYVLLYAISYITYFWMLLAIKYVLLDVTGHTLRVYGCYWLYITFFWILLAMPYVLLYVIVYITYFWMLLLYSTFF